MPTLTEISGRGFLPVELTTFIGRERELAELRRLLGSTRLLTLTGRVPASGHARSNTTSAWLRPCAPRWMLTPSARRSTSTGAS